MATTYRQIMVEVDDKVGKLAEVTEKIKAAGVNILALCAWSAETSGHLMMITDDPDKACEAVKPHVKNCRFGDVLCVKIANRVGSLNELAGKLADAGVFIHFTYCSAGDAEECTLILDTDDNAKAAEVI